MGTKIFVNVPIKDLPRTKTFFEALGFKFNPQFTDDKAGCLVISDDIFAMLLGEPYFQGFSKKALVNTGTEREMALALSVASKDAVNDLVDRAVAGGATEAGTAQDHGFMYFRGFDDLDGHRWSINWMDPTTIVGGTTPATKIFVNLPVKDLARSTDFFTKVGYSFNTQFTDENATCMVIGDDIFAMLLVEPFFQTIGNLAIADARKSSEVIVALSAESRDAVDAALVRALAAGATEPNAALDHGFMYTRSFEDLEGHIWEIFWMDPKVAAGEGPIG